MFATDRPDRRETFCTLQVGLLESLNVWRPTSRLLKDYRKKLLKRRLGDRKRLQSSESKRSQKGLQKYTSFVVRRPAIGAR